MGAAVRVTVVAVAALGLLAGTPACGSATVDRVEEAADAVATTSEHAAAEVATAAAPPAPLPAGQDLYRPPASLVDGPAGSLVWYQGVFPPVEGARAWRVLYRSRDDDGAPVLVSGLVVRPSGAAPTGGFPIVSWATGTPGLADRCAPSKGLPTVPRLRRLLREGFVVVATDGEGLGTRGPAHYLIGESEAHGLLDIARAARSVPGTAVSRRVALWGYSSGGHGVLAAAERVAEYAPDLRLLGASAVSPVVDVARFVGPVDDHPGFTFLTVGAWARARGVPLSAVLTERAMARVPRLRSECAFTLAFDWPLWRRQDLLRFDLRTTEPWRTWMAEELVGVEPLSGPLLVLHGDRDDIVVPGPTRAMVERQCRLGTSVDYRRLTRGDHFVAYTTAPEVVDWLVDRAAGRPMDDTCP